MVLVSLSVHWLVGDTLGEVVGVSVGARVVIMRERVCSSSVCVVLLRPFNTKVIYARGHVRQNLNKFLKIAYE